jgi:hypothetical protein
MCCFHAPPVPVREQMGEITDEAACQSGCTLKILEDYYQFIVTTAFQVDMRILPSSMQFFLASAMLDSYHLQVYKNIAKNNIFVNYS